MEMLLSLQCPVMSSVIILNLFVAQFYKNFKLFQAVSQVVLAMDSLLSASLGVRTPIFLACYI